MKAAYALVLVFTMVELVAIVTALIEGNVALAAQLAVLTVAAYVIGAVVGVMTGLLLR